MQKHGVHPKLWDLCIQWCAEMHNLTAHITWKLDGRTPQDIVTGETPDISEHTEFMFHDPCWHWDAYDPEEGRKMGLWCGVAHQVGQPMCYWILPASGVPIATRSVQPFSCNEKMDPQTVADLQCLKNKIHMHPLS